MLLGSFVLTIKHSSATCSKMQVRSHRLLWEPTGKANPNLQIKEQTKPKEHLSTPRSSPSELLLSPVRDKDPQLICFLWAREADRLSIPAMRWLVCRHSWLHLKQFCTPPSNCSSYGGVGQGTRGEAFILNHVGTLDASKVSPKEIWFP